MPSNRETGFMRRVLNSTAGLMDYSKQIQTDGDAVIATLKRGNATNKATKIEFRPGGAGKVHVTFLRSKAAKEYVISEHPSVYFDVLAELLFDQAGLLTGSREGTYIHNGSIRTTKW